MITLARPDFYRDVERAFEAFWSPSFRRRDDAQCAAAYHRDRAEGGEVTYFTLDAPTARGKTIVEYFLSEPRKGLVPAGQDYLRRLSATRMEVLRVEDVRINRGLTCTNMWSGAGIDVREVLLTHDVVPGNVIAARPFLAADGVWELDGALYPLTPEQGGALVAILRVQFSNAHEADPTRTEELFLKHRASAIINRYWFDHVFFVDADADDAEADDEDFDDDEDCDDDEDFAAEDAGLNADDAFPRRSRRPAGAMTNANSSEVRAAFHTDVASADSQVLELRDFLDSDIAPDAMPIDWLHGFLCGIACGPTNMAPSVWLTHVWGDTPPAFESAAQADQITGAIVNLASSIEYAVSAKTFVPLLVRSVTGDMTNIAQGWCAGFQEAIRLDAGGWSPLLEDEDQRVLLAPQLIISMSNDANEDDGQHAKAVAQSIEILPQMVSVIDDYWNPPQRSPLRAKRVLARRRPSNAGAMFDDTDVARVTRDPAPQ